MLELRPGTCSERLEEEDFTPASAFHMSLQIGARSLNMLHAIDFARQLRRLLYGIQGRRAIPLASTYSIPRPAPDEILASQL